MGKLLAMLYGLIAYAVFFASFLYAIAFTGNLQIEGIVDKTIDSGMPGELIPSIIVNVLLLGLFGIQHTVMARPGFKAAWTKIVPESIERSTYVLLSSLILFLIYFQWRPMPEMVWALEAGGLANQVVGGVFWAGWIIVLLSTFMIDHFELFGLSQVLANMQGRTPPTTAFKMNALYKITRHPIMLGFIIAFWAAPAMSQGHLLFAVVTTAYIFVALQFEERDLVNDLGDTYIEYRKKVRMIIPLPMGGGSSAAAHAPQASSDAPQSMGSESQATGEDSESDRL